LARLIVFILFGGFGVFLFIVGLTQYVQQRRLLAAAQPIDAVITRSEVHSSRSSPVGKRPLRDQGITTHRAEVAFRYEIDGREYESDLMRPAIIVRGYASSEGAAEELRSFPVGAHVKAYVDPTRPDKAFLIPEPAPGPLVFMIVGLAVVPLAWFGSKLV